jgi:hypothetical protein
MPDVEGEAASPVSVVSLPSRRGLEGVEIGTPSGTAWTNLQVGDPVLWRRLSGDQRFRVPYGPSADHTRSDRGLY